MSNFEYLRRPSSGRFNYGTIFLARFMTQIGHDRSNQFRLWNEMPKSISVKCHSTTGGRSHSLNSLYRSSGKISFVRREAAVGTMQLHRILLRSPSIASVLASPTKANLAALWKENSSTINRHSIATTTTEASHRKITCNLLDRSSHKSLNCLWS